MQWLGSLSPSINLHGMYLQYHMRGCCAQYGAKGGSCLDGLQDWLQRTIAKVDALLMENCRTFEEEKYKTVSTRFCS